MKTKLPYQHSITSCLLLLMAVIGTTGCEDGTTTDLLDDSMGFKGILDQDDAELDQCIPKDADLDSATLSVGVVYTQGYEVFAHRITSAWEEKTVTWNSFGGSYDAAVAGSFTPTAPGTVSGDMTDLVQGWVDGDYPNYGLLLEQSHAGVGNYLSSDTDAAQVVPQLEICYTDATGARCEVLNPQNSEIDDAYIRSTRPDANYGTTSLYTGVQDGTEAQSLIRFDICLKDPPEPCGKCKGKVTELTLVYTGDEAAEIEVTRKVKKKWKKFGRKWSRCHKRAKYNETQLFNGVVKPGEEFTIYGDDKKGTLGKEIYFYVDGVRNTKIRTSCSKKIGPGLEKGDFEVVEGYSRKGGLLCERK